MDTGRIQGTPGIAAPEPGTPHVAETPIPADTAALRALLASASPGPWTADLFDAVEGGTPVYGVGAPMSMDECQVAWADGRGVGREASRWNAALIAASVNALPALLDEVGALRLVAAAARGLVDYGDDMSNNPFTEWDSRFDELRSALDAARG